MPVVRRRVRVRRSSGPRLSSRTVGDIRLEKAGVDTVPKLITLISTGMDTISGVTAITAVDGPFSFNALNQMWNSATFATLKDQYKEVRMKQCKIHGMLQSVTGNALAKWTQGAPLILQYSWVRNAGYTALTPVAYTTTSVRPDAIQKVWGINMEKPEFWTTITAGSTSGEGNWLQTDTTPGQAPNTGMFFAPRMDANIVFSAAPTDGNCNFCYEVEFVAEFRGSKV